MPTQADSSPVAVPWFNNIWLAEATPTSSAPRSVPTRNTSTTRRRDRPPSANALAPASANNQQSASLNTISTLSAIEQISLVSFPSSVVEASTRSLEQQDDFAAQPLPGPPSAVVLARRASSEVAGEQLARQVHLVQIHRPPERAKDTVTVG